MNELYKDLNFNITTGPLQKSMDGNKEDKGKGKRIIRGYASVGDVMDRQGEVITLQALEFAKNDLLSNFTIFREHKHSELPIGKITDVILDDKGLLITVEISKASHANDIWQLIEEGILNSFSIGGRVIESQEKRLDNGTIFNEITKIELFETSVVGIPANPAAKFELVSKSFSRAIQEEIRKKEGKGNMNKSNEELIVPDDEGRVVTKVEAQVVEETKTESDQKVEKSEEIEEQLEDNSKEVTDTKNELEKSEEVTEEAIGEDVKVTDTLEVVEEVVKETKVEKTEEPAEEVSTPVSNEVEEEVVEKSTDEKILEMLGKIVGYFETKKEEDVEVTKSEETTEEKPVVEELEEVVEEATTETVEKDTELVKEYNTTGNETKEELVTKTVEVETNKVSEGLQYKIEEQATEEVDINDLKKSGIVIADSPYAEETQSVEVEKSMEELQREKDLGWMNLIFKNNG